MVVLEQNKPNELATIGKKAGFSVEIVSKRKVGMENLSVMKFTNRNKVLDVEGPGSVRSLS